MILKLKLLNDFNSLFFLSSNSLYLIEPFLKYNLLGELLPISCVLSYFIKFFVFLFWICFNTFKYLLYPGLLFGYFISLFFYDPDTTYCVKHNTYLETNVSAPFSIFSGLINLYDLKELHYL